MNDEIVAAFAALFAGYEKARGEFIPRGVSDSGKVQGRAFTVREGATKQHFINHLMGDGPQLGIIPLLADDTCWFGVIDIDIKTIDHAKLEQDAKDLPLVVCRSKSGGAHLYLFCHKPISARLIQDRLSEWATLLGYGGCEIFPKQTSRISDNDLGNWINLPYEGILKHQKSQRYATKNGKPVFDMLEFFRMVDSKVVTQEILEKLQVTYDGEIFEEGPPCLQTLEKQGFAEGSRKDGLFSVGVFFHKSNPDGWENDLVQFNMTHMSPPLGNSEVQDVIRSLKRKDYAYKCKQPPLVSFCNRRKCLAQPYGVGGGGVGAPMNVTFGAITKFESSLGDPYWIVDVNGVRIEVSDAQDLLQPPRFARLAFEKLNIAMPPIPIARWTAMLQVALSTIEIIEIPEEASSEGQFREILKTFLVTMATAKSRDGLVLGQAYEEDGTTYFRSQDLFAYLDSRRFKYKSHRAVWAMLSRLGANKRGFNCKDTYVNTWGVPSPERVSKDLDIPDFKSADVF
jgi:hypothetical protein